jgi:hypothetical protein
VSTGKEETKNVKLLGDYAYYAYGDGLVIVNIDDPPNAWLVSTFAVDDSTKVGAVGVNEDHAFLVHEYGLTAIDVTDPSSPLAAGECPLPERGAYYASDMVVTGANAHIANATSGVSVVNVFLTGDMAFKGGVDPLGEYFPTTGDPGMAYGLHVTDDYTYIADGVSGLQIVAAMCHSDPLSGVPSKPDPVICAGLLRSTPNPFAEGALVEYALPEAGDVKLEVFDVAGRLVNVLLDEVRPAGAGSVAWEGTDSQGHPVPAGIYFCRLTAGEQTRKTKILRLR